MKTTAKTKPKQLALAFDIDTPNRSRAELKFEELWLLLYPNIDLHSEYKFLEDRRFRFDFVHLPSKVAIEINRGNWNGGRHTRAGALDKEYEKYNLAAMRGWRIFTLSPAMITEFWVDAIAATIQGRQ